MMPKKHMTPNQVATQLLNSTDTEGTSSSGDSLKLKYMTSTPKEKHSQRKIPSKIHTLSENESDEESVEDDRESNYEPEEQLEEGDDEREDEDSDGGGDGGSDSEADVGGEKNQHSVTDAAENSKFGTIYLNFYGRCLSICCTRYRKKFNHIYD